MSSDTVTFLSSFLGILFGGIISLILFQWQRIKKEQSFAKILINILDYGEVKGVIEGIEDAKERNNLNSNVKNSEKEYLRFIMHLDMLTTPLTSKLPDLKTSYKIGTGYVYEIYDLRRIYNYFDQIKIFAEFGMNNKSNNEHSYKDMYETINKLIYYIPPGVKISSLKLKYFEEKWAFSLALKTLLPWYNILDKDFSNK